MVNHVFCADAAKRITSCLGPLLLQFTALLIFLLKQSIFTVSVFSFWFVFSINYSVVFHIKCTLRLVSISVYPDLEACVGTCDREQISLNFCVQVFLFVGHTFAFRCIRILSFLYLNIKKFKNVVITTENQFERIWEFP